MDPVFVQGLAIGNERVLSLDLSSKTGWSLISCHKVESGILPKIEIQDYDNMFELGEASIKLGVQIKDLVNKTQPTIIVIERPTKGNLAQTQSFLNFVHAEVVRTVCPIKDKVEYIWPAQWRKILDLKLSKEQKKSNAVVSKAKRLKVKKPKGIKGRIGKKHLSVQYVNTKLGTFFKLKDNDITDAICIALAYIKAHFGIEL